MTSTGFAVAQKRLDAAEDIDGKPVLHHDNETMARADRLSVEYRHLLQLLVIPVHPNQARPRRLVEGDSELHLGRRIDDGLVQIFDGLDEMARAQNEVAAIRNLQADRVDFDHCL
jgi:hypothetical protein